MKFVKHLMEKKKFQLGMNEMFTRDSKLNGLLEEDEPILISDTIHKAFIEVNEGGTESAAVTGYIRI